MKMMHQPVDGGRDIIAPLFNISAQAGLFLDVSMYVDQENADRTAINLSLLLPKHEVTLSTMTRIKARYINGKRETITDYADFYDNLTPEEYNATKIKDSKTAELV